MVLTTSTPNEINFKSSKKRKWNDALHNSLFSDKLSRVITETTECDDRENNQVLSQRFLAKEASNHDCNLGSLTKEEIEVKEEELSTRTTEIEPEINNCHHATITVCKVEDLSADPKTPNASENIEITDVKVENDPQFSTPHNLDINSMDLLSLSVKTETEVCQREKRPTSAEVTPNKQKRRRLTSDISSYDELPDGLKKELYNNDCEHIDMLHDLSSVINFEANNIDPNVFCSTINDTAESEEDKVTTEEEDPLSIHETETVYNQEIKRKKSRATKNSKSNVDDSEMNDYIKQLIGELDIEFSDSEASTIINEKLENEEDKEPDKALPGELTKNALPSELTKNALQELYNMKVTLMHEVPKQHTVEHTAGTKPLTKLQKKKFLSYGPIKSGAYTPKEDDAIRNNWERFCETHNWNPNCVRPFMKLKEDNRFYIKSAKERRKFIQFLANGLPWRTLYSVYRRFKHLYGHYDISFKRYSTAEDNKILTYVRRTKKGNVFVKLSEILRRPKSAIWKRYQRIKLNMKNKGLKKKKVEWTLENIGKFIKTFMDVTLSESVEDLKDAAIPKAVWTKIEKKLSIESRAMELFWGGQLHMQLFCPEPIYMNDIRIKLIEYMYGKGISSTREISWRNVAKYFDGFTTVFLCRTFLYLVHEAINKLHTKHFPDIIEYLYSNKIRHIINEPTDKFLPRLTYCNGKVKIKDEDELVNEQ